MKTAGRIILLAVLLLAVLAIISGCYEASKRSEVNREAIDRRYTAAYDSIETDYQYKYNLLEGTFVLVPEAKGLIRYQMFHGVLYAGIRVAAPEKKT